MQWCAPDADALLNDGKPIKAAFVHGCSHPANLSLLKRSLVQPSNGDVIFINIGANKITGRQTGRELSIGSFVRARIVSLSPDTSDPRRSKIGLTSKQDGLGSPQWSAKGSE